MAPSSKAAGVPKDKDRRKSSANAATKTTMIVKLTVKPDKLRAILDPTSEAAAKEDSPAKDAKDSPATSATVPPAPNSNTENASDSNPGTPAAGGTPAPSAMGPPGEGQGPKKKGVKRSAAAANGEPKVRGKPGPKKRQRMDDGTLEPVRMNGMGGHKLGPKANQGAINAGLRALDRSGKPCRKWSRGGFRLKTFTGVEWSIPRWTAPPKPKPVQAAPEDGSASQPASAPVSAPASVPASGPASGPASVQGSNKENAPAGAANNDAAVGQQQQPVGSDNSNNSNSGGDVDMQSAPSVQPSSPAPVPIAAGA